MYKCTVDRTAYDRWQKEKCGVSSCITTEEICKKCTFPFTYEGVTHTACTTHGGRKPWCATKTDENGVYLNGYWWGSCNMDKCTDELTLACASDSCITTKESKNACSKCVFPFTDKKGKTHTSCATKPMKHPWCATKTDKNGVIEKGHWGFCNMDKCTDACAVDSCITTKESKNPCSKCVFPFTDKKGKTHTSCATKPLKHPWCATKTDEDGVIQTGHWGFCDESKCST